jgi:hypothetical protein
MSWVIKPQFFVKREIMEAAQNDVELTSDNIAWKVLQSII